MTYRIAMNFAILFLVTGLFLLFLFLLIRMKSIAGTYRLMAEDFAYAIETGRMSEEELAEKCASLCVISSENKEEVYRIGEEPGRLFGGKWMFCRPKGTLQVYIRHKAPLVFSGAECSVEFLFECTGEWNQLFREWRSFAFWYLGITVIAVFVCFVLIQTELLPIRTMAEQVNRLTLQNIHGRRLNEEGTENELKVLAAVINRMLDRMEETYESQKQFVSEASHELRTPITVLQGYSSMLRRWGSEDREVLAESVKAIEEEAKSMQELVEKLLFLSRHERKKLPFAKERFDMAEVVGELEKEFDYLSGHREMSCPVCESVSVYGDRQLIKQALRVFLDNAVKYTNDGDRICVYCRNRSGACEVVVEDSGIGMKKEELEHIFARFYRADTVRGKNIDGHGLGLSIARLIIDGHAGKITIRSQYTKGSSFMITIPRQRSK